MMSRTQIEKRKRDTCSICRNLSTNEEVAHIKLFFLLLLTIVGTITVFESEPNDVTT